MTAEFLGREKELVRIHEAIQKGRGGLLLVLGRPHVGKQEFLRQLWSRLGDEGTYQLLPAGLNDEFLRVDPRTSVESFKLEVNAFGEANQGIFSGRRVIGVFGYQPSPSFAAWFTSNYVREISHPRGRVPALVQGPVADAHEPGPVSTTLVVAAFERDVEELRHLAAAEPIVLKPLPVQILKDHLTARTSDLTHHLTPEELDAYVGLVREDAGELKTLLRILDLDRTRHAG